MVGTWRLSVQHTANSYPLSTFPVTSKVAVRRCPAARAARQWIPFNDVSDASSTDGEAADLVRRRRRRRRPPSAQAARQRIPFNDVSDGVASSSTDGEAADPMRRTSLDNFTDGVVSQFHDSHTRTPAF